MHIILYILDALRADHLGSYGYERPVSPHMDALAQDGVLFKHCFTTSTWTRPVAASILTGAYPAVHQVRSRQEMFSTPLVRLPESLQQVGFKTAAFCTMGNIAGGIGFNRGFDQYHDLFNDPDILAKRRPLDATDEALLHVSQDDIALPLAEDIHAPLFRWLETHRSQHTFSFIWSIETHVPYAAPDDFRRFAQDRKHAGEGDRDDVRSAGAKDAQRLIDLYDDEIVYNDHCIGQIVQYLEKTQLYDDTLFIILGDHGEAFYEHGVYAHGHAPYEEVLHVPLIMKLPANEHAGRRVDALVELVDLYPTIMDLVDGRLEGSPLIQGHSLRPLLEGQVTQVRDHAFSDTQTLEIHNRYLSVRGKRWKYMQFQRPKRDRGTIFSTITHIFKRRLFTKILRSPRHFLRNYFKKGNESLFDLSADMEEQFNLADQFPDHISKFRKLLAQWQAENEALAKQVGSTDVTYEENEDLKQHLLKLGYLEE